ncbi:expressed unknown protein [Seminavis robusta]|uniref:Uncharacterized protein n=1 Tax=Seminavis robusta TaxID=568900 RepID=A0A9N8EZL9_9STRA|nr:expressed unknown protein [Seminavis robusta]|eukprot:Sro2241_g320380.1 n/a (129) ;mRNA; f:11735-12121
MRLVIFVVLVVTLFSGCCHGLQSPVAVTISSRRGFGATLAAGAAIVVGSQSAVAADDDAGKKKANNNKTKKDKGGYEYAAADATWYGTVLNEKESQVAGGLLDKLGVDDIAPDKDAKTAGKGKFNTVK